MPAFLDRSKAYLESGLHFDPPHERCFRLELCDHVKTLKGRGLHEMDFGWWDEPEHTMHLLEVKDYSLPQAKLAPKDLVNECVQKATDCLLLLASIWYDLPAGPQMKAGLPEEWHEKPGDPRRLRLSFVIKTFDDKDCVELNKLQATMRNRLNGRTELLELRKATEVFLMDHRTAAAHGLPIKTEQELVGAPDSSRPPRKGKRRAT